MSDIEKQVIFILDDEEPIRSMLTEFILKKIPDIEVYPVESCIELMDHPMLEKISLLIIDIELDAKMKGHEVVEELFEMGYDIPYLLMSGNSYDFNYFCESVYTYDFISKPIDFKKLINRISVLLKVSYRYIADKKEIITKQNFLDDIIEQSPHASWISDMNGTLIRSNKALRTQLKVTDEQILNKYNVFEDQIMIKNGYIDKIKEVYTKGKILKLKIEWKGVDAGYTSEELIYFDGIMFPIYNSDGVITNTVCSWIDISKEKILQKEKEQLQLSLKDVFDYTNIYLVILSKDMIIKLCSFKLAHDLGYKGEDELLGESWNQFLNKETIIDINTVHKNVIDNSIKYQKHMREVTNKIITKTGATISVKWFNSRIQNGETYTFSIGIPYNRSVTADDDIESIRAYWKHVIDKDNTTLQALKTVV